MPYHGSIRAESYGYVNVKSNSDYIKAKSMYYNEPLFSDVSINMSVKEIEDYNMDIGVCFGKVYVYLIKLCINN